MLQNFDLISTAAIAASATVVVVTFIAAFGKSMRQRGWIAAVLSLWFASVLWLGASGVLGAGSRVGVAGLGLAVVFPFGLLCAIAYGSAFGRRTLAEASAFPLVFVQSLRVLGILFVLLYGAHRLPAPFAPLAGWGDIVVGLEALLVALFVRTSYRHVRAYLLIWSAMGIVDLVTAITLGALSSPGPMRMFWQSPGSSLMTSLPWILIPCFLVPCFLFAHMVALSKLGARGLQSMDARQATDPRAALPMAVSSRF